MSTSSLILIENDKGDSMNSVYKCTVIILLAQKLPTGLVYRDILLALAVGNMALDLRHTRAYPEVSGLAAWSENCKWYGSLTLGAVLWLFCESV
jgi:hypothetical protein